MEQRLLLDKKFPRRVKQEPGTEGYFHTHVCKHCGSFLRIPWKDKKKKVENGGSCHAMNAQKNVKKNCDAEGLASVLYSLQAVEDRGMKHDEEETEK